MATSLSTSFENEKDTVETDDDVSDLLSQNKQYTVTNLSTCDLVICGITLKSKGSEPEVIPNFDPTTHIHSEFIRAKMLSVE
jgi:hypothetical protein